MKKNVKKGALIGDKFSKGISVVVSKIKENKKVALIAGGVGFAIFILFILLLITGGKTLTCVKLSTDDYMLYSEEVKVTFKKDSVKKLKMNYEMELAEGADYSALEVANDMEEDCNELIKDNDIKGIKCKVDYNDNRISFDLKASGESFKYALDLDDERFTYLSLKEELSDEGYFCK